MTNNANFLGGGESSLASLSAAWLDQPGGGGGSGGGIGDEENSYDLKTLADRYESAQQPTRTVVASTTVLDQSLNLMSSSIDKLLDSFFATEKMTNVVAERVNYTRTKSISISNVPSDLFLNGSSVADRIEKNNGDACDTSKPTAASAAGDISLSLNDLANEYLTASKMSTNTGGGGTASTASLIELIDHEFGHKFALSDGLSSSLTNTNSHNLSSYIIGDTNANAASEGILIDLNKDSLLIKRDKQRLRHLSGGGACDMLAAAASSLSSNASSMSMLCTSRDENLNLLVATSPASVSSSSFLSNSFGTGSRRLQLISHSASDACLAADMDTFTSHLFQIAAGSRFGDFLAGSGAHSLPNSSSFCCSSSSSEEMNDENEDEALLMSRFDYAKQTQQQWQSQQQQNGVERKKQQQQQHQHRRRLITIDTESDMNKMASKHQHQQQHNHHTSNNKRHKAATTSNSGGGSAAAAAAAAGSIIVVSTTDAAVIAAAILLDAQTRAAASSSSSPSSSANIVAPSSASSSASNHKHSRKSASGAASRSGATSGNSRKASKPNGAGASVSIADSASSTAAAATPVQVFDFSIPSPDDIVISKQKLAFKNIRFK